MDTTTGKRTARVKLTLTKRTVENLQPADKPWIAWDARLIGFGVRVQPSGAKAFIINYRTGSGGRKARNRRIAIGRCGHLAPEDARRLAQELLGRVARGEDPAQERAESRGMPTLREAFEEYLTANPNRKSTTEALYQSQMRYCLGDWLARPLDTITRRDVEDALPSRFATEWLGRGQPHHRAAALRVPAARAWTTRRSATRWTFGSPVAGVTTAPCVAGSRRPPRRCPAGGRPSRPR